MPIHTDTLFDVVQAAGEEILTKAIGHAILQIADTNLEDGIILLMLCQGRIRAEIAKIIKVKNDEAVSHRIRRHNLQQKFFLLIDGHLRYHHDLSLYDFSIEEIFQWGGFLKMGGFWPERLVEVSQDLSTQARNSFTAIIKETFAQVMKAGKRRSQTFSSVTDRYDAIADFSSFRVKLVNTKKPSSMKSASTADRFFFQASTELHKKGLKPHHLTEANGFTESFWQEIFVTLC